MSNDNFNIKDILPFQGFEDREFIDPYTSKSNNNLDKIMSEKSQQTLKKILTKKELQTINETLKEVKGE